jgi:hypothetical protein
VNDEHNLYTKGVDTYSREWMYLIKQSQQQRKVEQPMDSILVFVEHMNDSAVSYQWSFNILLFVLLDIVRCHVGGWLNSSYLPIYQVCVGSIYISSQIDIANSISWQRTLNAERERLHSKQCGQHSWQLKIPTVLCGGRKRLNSM